MVATINSAQPLSLSQIKAVADGVVAASQWTSRVAPEAAARLANNLVAGGHL